MGRLQRQLLMLGRVCNLLGVRGIDKRVVKKARHKFRVQHARRRAVNHCLRNFPLLDLLAQTRIRVGKWQLNVHSRFQRKFCGRHVIRHDVMYPLQFRNSKIIGDDQPVETPLMPQNVVEEVLVAVRRNAVDLVVGRHQRPHVTLLHGSFERL